MLANARRAVEELDASFAYFWHLFGCLERSCVVPRFLRGSVDLLLSEQYKEFMKALSNKNYI